MDRDENLAPPPFAIFISTIAWSFFITYIPLVICPFFLTDRNYDQLHCATLAVCVGFVLLALAHSYERVTRRIPMNRSLDHQQYAFASAFFLGGCHVLTVVGLFNFEVIFPRRLIFCNDGFF